MPGTRVAIAALPSIAPMFEEITNAAQDELIVVGDPRAEVTALAAGKFDAALLLPNSFRSALSATTRGSCRALGICRRIRGASC